MKIYAYKVVQELPDGSYAKRSRTLRRREPSLKVGCAYTHLGRGFEGLYRVLEVTEEEIEN